jgi:hypothetical protein
MVSNRDQRLEISSAEKRAQRSNIVYPAIDPEADAWQRGIVRQVSLESHPAP